jgi:hypothetical protein
MAARRALPPTDAAKAALVAHGAVQEESPVAPAAPPPHPDGDAAETAAEPSENGAAAGETQAAVKARQRAAQPRMAASSQSEPSPVEPEPEREPLSYY